MSNIPPMTDHQFESKKNLEAGLYTAIVCGLILAISMLLSWSMPLPPDPLVDEGIEVNLGNSDFGLGTNQAYEPGPPAPSNQVAYAPPQPVADRDNNVKDIETNDNDEDAPVIKKPAETKPNATKVPEKETAKPKTAAPKAEAPPAPPVPKPKALFKGVDGNGSGGNEADTYKKGGNEGNTSGTGDMGRPGGNPDSKNYTGGGSGNGIRISKGLSGRTFVYQPKYEDEFNENATVAVDIRVDRQGNVISATFQMRGSTTAESYYKQKAIEVVKKSKLNADPNGPEEQTGTVLVNFRVKG